MYNSINKRVFGLVLLSLSIFCALPASATILLSCTGTLDAEISPGLAAVPQAQDITAQAAIASSLSCTLLGTTVQPARLSVVSEFSSGSCLSFTLVPGTTQMEITWDDNTTGMATYAPTNPSGFPLSGPFAADFLITSGHAAGRTVSIAAGVPISTALVACPLQGSVKHLGAPISFTVK